MLEINYCSKNMELAGRFLRVKIQSQFTLDPKGLHSKSPFWIKGGTKAMVEVP